MTAPRVRHLFYDTEKLKSSLDFRSVISLYSRHQAALDLFERDTRTAAFEAANRKRNLCAFALCFHGLTSRLLFPPSSRPLSCLRRRRAAARAFGHLPRPTDDVLLELGVRHVLLARAHAPAHRDAGRVHRLGVAGDQRVAPVEFAPPGQQAIAAGRREP